MTFDKFIYENFFDNYHGGTKDVAIGAYEDYRNDLNDDDYMRLSDMFAKHINKELLDALKALVNRATYSEESMTVFINAKQAISKAEGV